MRKLYVCCAAMLAALGPATAAAGWSDYGQIIEVYVQANQSVYVKLDVPLENPMTCSGVRYKLSINNNAYSQLLATLLSARAATQDVQLYISGASCDGQNPKIDHVRIGAP